MDVMISDFVFSGVAFKISEAVYLIINLPSGFDNKKHSIGDIEDTTTPSRSLLDSRLKIASYESNLLTSKYRVDKFISSVRVLFVFHLKRKWGGVKFNIY